MTGHTPGPLRDAAPDLLRELKNLRERFYNCMVSNGTAPENAAISCQKADAAIAKAEGRS